MLQNLPEEGLGKEVETLQTFAKKLSGVCDWFGHLFSQSDVLKAILLLKEANHAERYIPNIILNLHPLLQSRIRTLRRAAPSQTEVTDLNCSDHLTTSSYYYYCLRDITLGV